MTAGFESLHNGNASVLYPSRNKTGIITGVATDSGFAMV